MDVVTLLGIGPLIFNAIVPLIVISVGLGIAKLLRRSIKLAPLIKPVLAFIGTLYLLSIIPGIIVLTFIEGTVSHQWDRFGYFLLVSPQYPSLSECPSWIAYGYTFVDLYLWWLLAMISVFVLSIWLVTHLYRSSEQPHPLRKMLLIFAGLWIVVFGVISFPYQEQMSPAERRQLCSFERVNEPEGTIFHSFRDTLDLSFSTTHPVTVTTSDTKYTAETDNTHWRSDDQIIITLPEADPNIWDDNPNKATITMQWYRHDEWMEEGRPTPPGSFISQTDNYRIADSYDAQMKQWNTPQGTFTEFVIYPYAAGETYDSDQMLRITVEPYMSDEIEAILDSLNIE